MTIEKSFQMNNVFKKQFYLFDKMSKALKKENGKIDQNIQQLIESIITITLSIIYDLKKYDQMNEKKNQFVNFINQQTIVVVVVVLVDFVSKLINLSNISKISCVIENREVFFSLRI